MESIYLCLSGFNHLVLTPNRELGAGSKLMPILSYSVYLNKKMGILSLTGTDADNELQKPDIVDYLGHIIIESNEKTLYFKSAHEQCLNAAEVEELADLVLKYLGKHWLEVMKKMWEVLGAKKSVNGKDAA